MKRDRWELQGKAMRARVDMKPSLGMIKPMKSGMKMG
jgi:hypothetical protein